MYRLITNVKCRLPEEMHCVSFSHLVQTATLIPPRLLCFTGCNKGDCKQNYHCKTFQLLGEKNRRAVSISFPTQFSCIKVLIWNNFWKTNFQEYKCDWKKIAWIDVSSANVIENEKLAKKFTHLLYKTINCRTPKQAKQIWHLPAFY